MTLQSQTATLIPLISSSELTGCGYPGLLDRKNRSDMCPRWESNPRLPACKASTLSTRPGSPLCSTVGIHCTTYSRHLSACCCSQIYIMLFELCILAVYKGENLRHDQVLKTVNIFGIKRKKSSTRKENQLHLRSYRANFNAIRSS